MRKTITIIFVLALAALFALPAAAEERISFTQSLKLTLHDAETGTLLGDVIFKDLPGEEPLRSRRIQAILTALQRLNVSDEPRAFGRKDDPVGPFPPVGDLCGTAVYECGNCPPVGDIEIDCCPSGDETCTGASNTCTCADVPGPGGVRPIFN
jgi:hypothetical protein